MIRQTLEGQRCSIARALTVLGDEWSLLILREAFLGTRRFSDFQARLGVSKNVLSKRLRHLCESGVLERDDAGVHGTRYEYGLTRMGKDLVTVVTALRQWGDRWLSGEGNEPVLVLDRATGEPVEPVRIRRADGSLVPARDMIVTLGPGA